MFALGSLVGILQEIDQCNQTSQKSAINENFYEIPSGSFRTNVLLQVDFLPFIHATKLHQFCYLWRMRSEQHILVTGGAGFIGSHTVVALIERGYIPVIVDDFRNSNEGVLKGIESIVGSIPETVRVDVTDKEALRKVFVSHKFSGVIHFAAYKAVGESVKEPLKYYHNNLIGLTNCLELCEEFDVRNVVFSSSCTVYGEPDSVKVSEETPQQKASSPYGITKQLSEQIMSDVHRSGSKLKLLSLRYFNPVGAHPSGAIGELPIGVPNNLVPYLTQTAIGKLEKLTVFGNDYATEDGTCIRDFIHVMDLAQAHIDGLNWLFGKDAPLLEVFNIGTGEGASILEIIHTFERVTGVSLNWAFGPRREGDVSRIYADVSKAARELNWKANYALEDCLRDAWNWEQKLADAK